MSQSKQSSTGGNRRARTSAAMIGLALSMGASSLLLPRQDDGALAAEPMSAESTTTVFPLAFEVAALPSGAEVELESAPIRMVRHSVRDGETLWSLARRYQVSVNVISEANDIPADSVIQVGQVLQVPVPTQARSSQATHVDDTAAISTGSTLTRDSQSLAPESKSNPAVESGSSVSSVESNVKAERDDSLQRLRQQRDRLRNSLTELRSNEAEASSENVAPKAQAEPTESTASTDPTPANAAPQSAASYAPPKGNPAPSPVASDISGDNASTIATGFTTYQVKPGDTLGSIALEHHIAQHDLARVNRLDDLDRLQVDQLLTVPQSSPSLGNSDSVKPETPTSSLVYRVVPGDTIDGIARLHDVSRAALIELNHLNNPNVILIGQVLQVPADSAINPGNLVDSSTTPVPFDGSSTTFSVPSAQVVPEVPSNVVASTQLSEVVNVPTAPVVEPYTGNTYGAATSATPSDVTGSSALFSTEFIGTSPSAASNQQVASAPLHTPPVSNSPTEVTTPNPYVENLMTEIISLRDRYRAEREDALMATPQPAVVAAAPTVPTVPVGNLTDPSRVDPQFSPRQFNQIPEVASPNQASASVRSSTQVPAESLLPQAPSAAEPQVVAVAPLGSENYQPLIQPLTGQMVSPDLPPLPSAEAFLPDGVGSFNGYIWPARGVLTSGYGWRWGRMHRGIDIGAPVGTPVYSAADGVIETSGWNSGGYGNMVEVRHADGSMTRYAHLSRSLVRAGQTVTQGQQIAEVGSTGYSTGPHLHFEVHLPDQGTVNPIAYLPR